MSDLLQLTLDASLFRNLTTATPPTECDIAQATLREALFQQLNISDYIALDFVVAANAIAFPIPALPAAPYDAVLIIFTDIAVRANINAQGFQIIGPGGFVTMAATSTVTFTNDIIPPGQTIPIPTTQPAHIRYFAAKLAV